MKRVKKIAKAEKKRKNKRKQRLINAAASYMVFFSMYTGVFGALFPVKEKN